MSDKVEIKITGSNQTGPAFQGVARDATQMGNSVDQAGQKASRSLQDLSAKSALVGAAIGSATMVLGEWSRAAAEDAANQSRLQQSIENTGKSYDDYSIAVEKAIKLGQEKAFGDDATREALVRLNAVTNDAGASLDQLGLVMDFARAKGISLADSAGIIAKVYGGNLGILSRYGIVLDENATSTEALAKIQQISAGQAAVYAESQLGWIDKQKDKWGELTETIGASTGELQQFLMLMPGLTAGATALAGLIGGVGGIGAASTALLKVGGPLAVIAGSGALAYGYSQDTLGTTQINSLANQFFMTMSNVLNELLPGNPYDPTKYTDQMATNAQWDQINSVFAGQGLSQEVIVQAVAKMAGVVGTISDTGGSQQVFDEYGNPRMEMVSEYTPPTADQVLAAIVSAAATGNMDIATYIRSLTSTSHPTATTSLVGAATVPTKPYTGPYQPNGGFAQYSTAPYYYGDGGVAPPVTGMAIGDAGSTDISGYRTGPADSATYSADAVIAQQEKLTAELESQLGAWSALAGGITSASDAQSALHMSTSVVIEQQGVYSGQISEYSQQESALTAARDVLLERQAEGITLTEEEQALLDNYPSLYERVTGGVDDATVSAGLLAAQYIENMKLGDELNQNMNEQTGAVGALTRTIEEMILQMEGVPTEVKTQILLENADESVADLIRYLAWINSIPGYVQTVVDTVYTVTGSDGETRDRTARLGGVVGYANGGTVRATLAEAGPELLEFRNGGSAWAMAKGEYDVPKGTYVNTAPASKLKAGSSGGGLTININAPVSIYPATSDVQREFTSALVGDWRQ